MNLVTPVSRQLVTRSSDEEKGLSTYERSLWWLIRWSWHHRQWWLIHHHKDHVLDSSQKHCSSFSFFLFFTISAGISCIFFSNTARDIRLRVPWRVFWREFLTGCILSQDIFSLDARERTWRLSFFSPSKALAFHGSEQRISTSLRESPQYLFCGRISVEPLIFSPKEYTETQ